MRPSLVSRDIDGEQWPDPLTINYQSAIDNYDAFPEVWEINTTDLKKLWLAYYRKTEDVEMDDVLYSINGIEHVGQLEPGDQILMYDPELVESFGFKDLT